ncbi:LacI family DNA-binding transcriptional regulator [Bacillus sp. 31A1R]|uniref:LacI family DNA-binding transcriptional regulator n=1 Tax=Robertmurraya mangrovi TaxID=3098077 RepID=A0ABU5IWE1_9BACI|nr:LacI family DNA-binding transcriptional regulator [Bacillus sp. 31A1R]MDZ5471462.1 LacI family DNA-binding transcriptional regulator [Bacillus sp. 31A1R]
MEKTPNLNEVAKLAGVSIMTVSRVINNSGKVSEKTKQKVLDAIKEIDYQPNMIARSLARKKTNILGLVIYSEEGVHPTFYNEIMNGVQSGASELGYDLLIFAQNDEQSYRNRIIRSSLVDGVIFMGIHVNEDDIRSVHEKGFPYVFVGKREVKGIEPYYISPNYIEGTKVATNYLIEQGHQKIGFIGQSKKIAPDYDKFLGYKQGLKEHGITYNEKLVSEQSQSQADGYNAMKEMLKHKPTAVMLNNTYTTLGAITAIKEEGLVIPDDISVIGFDDNQELNQQFNDFIGLDLTSLQIPKLELGKQAAKLTISLVEGNEHPKANYLDLVFLQKNSCQKL